MHIFKRMTLNIWVLMRENLSFVFAYNKGGDEPVHPGALISAFLLFTY